MRVDVEIKQGPPKVAVITPHGYLEAVASRLLREKLKQIEEEGARRVVLDLADVQFISSSALSLLIGFVTRKKGEWGPEPLILVGPGPTVLESIRTLGLESLFVIEETLEAALNRCGLI